MDHNELLWDRWVRHAREQPTEVAIVHWRAGAAPFRWTWQALLQTARSAADYLTASGVRRGNVCALIVRHHPYFYPLYLGVSAIGAIPAVLAYPNERAHPDKFKRGSGRNRATVRPRLAAPEEALTSVLHSLVTQPDSRLSRGELLPLEAAWAKTPHREPASEGLFGLGVGAASDSALLQHSSGTTGLRESRCLIASSHSGPRASLRKIHRTQ